MQRNRYIISLLLTVFSMVVTFAQNVTVSVTPVSDVLPPQVGLYYSSPDKFFTISLTNTGVTSEEVYLALQLEQLAPSQTISISTPSRRQPMRPFVVAPNQTYTLSMYEMKHLFDYVPANEVSIPAEFLEGFLGNNYGLLPEGQYQVNVTAYKWVGGSSLNQNPVAVSNPANGKAIFTVCYKAQPPKILTPISLLGEGNVAEISEVSPLITWTTPIVSCNPRASKYRYDVRIVHLMKGQEPDYALDHNPIFYQVKNLVVSQCMIPNYYVNQMIPGDTYVAQITAQSAATNTNLLDYSLIENEGKSDILMFKLPSTQEDKKEAEEEENKGEKKDSVEKKGVDDLNRNFIMGDVEFNDSIVPDSNYTFRNPQIITPAFLGGDGVRKLFTNNDIAVEFRKAWYIGGVAQEQDTVKIAYKLELFDGGQVANREEALKTKPIYTSDPTNQTDSIKWDKIKDSITPGDYMVLRVTASTKTEGVAFINDSINIIDFALIDHVVKKYFQCSNMVEIEDTKMTSKKAEDFVGKTIAMGEYNLTIDKCKNATSGEGFNGEGRIEWTPLGTKIMLCVTFDTLKVNKDNVAFGGLCKTVTAPEMKSADMVNEIFSDLGIDEFMSSSSIPYASSITNATKSGVSSAVGSSAQIGEYYKDIKKGIGVIDFLIDDEIDNVKFPIALPKDVSNLSPVDIQVISMAFSPFWATMNIVGEFQVPGSKWESDDVLMFGAPRVCISPDSFLPESGTLALLGDFNIQDPKSGYKMTFKAPQNLQEPTDGCYVSWHDNGFELLGVDIDMKIPNLCKEGEDGQLKKDSEGKYEMPNLKIVTSIGRDWEDWMVDNITMDPFQVESLPGYTFKATNIVLDHSTTRSAAAMGKFPAGYDNAEVRANPESWMGLYIKDITVKFPDALEFGETEGDKRLTVALDNMFWDNTGITFDLGAGNVLSAKTGKAGGWAFSLDKICMRVVQDNFDQCYFNGSLEVPVLKGTVGYKCNIIRQMQAGKATGEYAYIFNTQQIDSLSMNLFLADMKFSKEQTYFLVESVPEDGKQVTRIELLLSGVMEIGGTARSDMQKELDKLPMKLKIPDVHFAKMRFANCKQWKSKYEVSQALQNAIVEVKGKEFVTNEDYELVPDAFYFSRGSWSLASLEKSIGPFKLGIDDYKIDLGKTDKGGKTLDLGIVGTVGIMDAMIDAKCAVTIKTEILGLDKVMKFDFGDLDFKYHETRFDSITVTSKMNGLDMKGKLAFIYPTDAEPEKGFKGELSLTLPQNIFSINAAGGFYNHEEEGNEFKWGFLRMKMAAPIPLGPVQLSSIQGGFYFNCKPKDPLNDDTDAVVAKGTIGIMAGIGLATAGAPETVNGNVKMVIVYDKPRNCFSNITLNGDVHLVASPSNLEKGLINGKASLVYQNDSIDRYLAINITADASVEATPEQFAQFTGADINSYIQDFSNAMEEFDAANDDTAKDNKCKEKTKGEEKGAKAKMSAGFHISLDMRFELTMPSRPKSKCKWHVYVGEPGSQEDVDNGTFDGKRCSFTFFDFQVGSKNDPIALWAKSWANGYVCIGNELPNNGQLPGIPSEIKKFLDGKDINGNRQQLSSSAQEKRQKAMSAMETKGGVMVGAAIGGGFGCNAVIAYCDVEATAGFDVILKKVEGEACLGSNHPAGKNGWYATGQAYGYVKGEIGLMLNLWIFTGKMPLIDAELGLLFQAGLPNPTWLYGKARARCSLFSGLVKFNQSIEIEAGEVCQMAMSNPLEDVNIFGDTTPDAETREDGWADDAEETSIYIQPRFATNMKMGTQLRLISSDADSDNRSVATYQRTYRFSFMGRPTMALYSSKTQKTGAEYPVQYSSSNNDKENWTLNTPVLKPNSYYSFTVKGTAEELRNGRWGNPYHTVNDPKTGEAKEVEMDTVWTQTITRYFKTGERPDHLVTEDLIAAFPGKTKIGGNKEDALHVANELYVDEARFPYFAMRESRADLIPEGYTLRGRLEKKKQNGEWELIQELPAGEFDNRQSTWKCVNWALSDPLKGSLTDRSTFNYTFRTDETYRFSFVRRDENMFRKFMEDAEKKTVAKQTNTMSSRTKQSKQAELEALRTKNEGGDAPSTSVSKTSSLSSKGFKTAFKPTTTTSTSADDTYNLTDLMRQRQLENELEEAEFTQETTVKVLETNNSDADYYKVLYSQEFTMHPITDAGIHSFKKHAEYLAKNGYVSKVNGQRFTNADAVVTYLDESSRRYAVMLDWINTTDKDPYNEIINEWASFNFIAGFSLPSFSYFANPITTTRGMAFNFAKPLYDKDGNYVASEVFAQLIHSVYNTEPEFAQTQWGSMVNSHSRISPFNNSWQFEDWIVYSSVFRRTGLAKALNALFYCEANDIAWFYYMVRSTANSFKKYTGLKSGNIKTWNTSFMNQAISNASGLYSSATTDLGITNATNEVTRKRYDAITLMLYQFPLLYAISEKKDESKWNDGRYLLRALNYSNMTTGGWKKNDRYLEAKEIYESLYKVNFYYADWLKTLSYKMRVGVPMLYNQGTGNYLFFDSYELKLNYK